jgi:hypothetical protein
LSNSAVGVKAELVLEEVHLPRGNGYLLIAGLEEPDNIGSSFPSHPPSTFILSRFIDTLPSIGTKNKGGPPIILFNKCIAFFGATTNLDLIAPQPAIISGAYHYIPSPPTHFTSSFEAYIRTASPNLLIDLHPIRFQFSIPRRGYYDVSSSVDQ